MSDIEDEFDPTEIEAGLMGFKELRMWHWGSAMHFRKHYNEIESQPGSYSPGAAIEREQHLLHLAKLINFHIKACNLINDIIPGTGESDMMDYVATKRKSRLH